MLADHRDEFFVDPGSNGVADGAFFLIQKAIDVVEVHAGKLAGHKSSESRHKKSSQTPSEQWFPVASRRCKRCHCWHRSLVTTEDLASGNLTCGCQCRRAGCLRAGERECVTGAEPRPLVFPPEERDLHRAGLDGDEVEARGPAAAR